MHICNSDIPANDKVNKTSGFLTMKTRRKWRAISAA